MQYTFAWHIFHSFRSCSLSLPLPIAFSSIFVEFNTTLRAGHCWKTAPGHSHATRRLCMRCSWTRWSNSNTNFSNNSIKCGTHWNVNMFKSGIDLTKRDERLPSASTSRLTCLFGCSSHWISPTCLIKCTIRASRPIICSIVCTIWKSNGKNAIPLGLQTD